MRQFRLDKIEVCCGLQKLVRPMMLQGCCKADRAEVVERDRFATPNPLKSHGERNLLSPFSNPCAITPKLCTYFEAEVLRNPSATNAKLRGILNSRIPTPHRLTYPFPRFPPLEVCVRRPRCAPRYRHGAGIRKPSQKRSFAHRMSCNRSSRNSEHAATSVWCDISDGVLGSE